MSKLQIKLKVITVKQETFDTDYDAIMKRLDDFAVIDVVSHSGLVTIVYQDHYTVLEHNLSQLTKKELEQLAKKDNVQIYAIRYCKTEKNRQDLEDEISHATLEDKETKYKFIRRNLGNLFSDKFTKKERKQIFNSYGVVFYTIKEKRAKKTKQELINSILKASYCETTFSYTMYSWHLLGWTV